MKPETLAATHLRAFAGQGRGWSAAEFGDLLDSPHVFAVGDARAFALGRTITDEAELLTLATDPAHRRAGLARAALAAFEVRARARGALRGFLEVAAGNTAARALYADAGWREGARRRGYYPGPGGKAEDALVLEKHLG